MLIGSSSPQIRNCSITGNTGSNGGINISGGTSLGAVITGCLIDGNSADYGCGSGMTFNNMTGSLDISYCVISNNSSITKGTVSVNNTDIEFTGCLFVGNSALDGGALELIGSNASFRNSTIASNTANGDGGSIFGYESVISLQDNILWDNSAAGSGDAVMLANYHGSTLNIDYCDIQGGTSEILYDSSSTLNWGAGNMDENPLFTTGSLGSFYLSHIDSGQMADSPCRNAGSAEASAIQIIMPWSTIGLDQMTVRTDHIADAYTVDLGFHYWSDDIVIPTPDPTDTPTETPTITQSGSPTATSTPEQVPSIGPAGIGFMLALVG